MGAPSVALYSGRIYPGLRPFDLDDALLFFGRDVQTDQLLRRLDDTRFLAVVGLSGSGKSSLVRAGLLPALKRGHLAGAGSQWRVAIMRPGSDPLGALARVLDETLGQRDDRLRMLRFGKLGLTDTSRQGRSGDENLLLVIDQFEEIFRFQDTFHQRATEGAHFVDLLLSTTEEYEASWRVYVVITLRSDYLGECARFRGLPEALNESQYLVPRMTREELREAIDGPATLGAVQLNSELREELLDKTGDDPDQLPLLQHLLMRMWEVRQVTEGVSRIGRDHYDKVDGWDDALNGHANAVLEALGKRGDLAKRIFQRLTDRLQPGREVRRPSTVRELAAVAEAGPEEIIAVVEFYRAEGCHFLTSPDRELTEDSIIDISHETLIRRWKELRKWIGEEAEWGAWYRRVEDRTWLNSAHLVEPELDMALQAQAHGHWNEAWAQRYAATGLPFTEVVGFLEESSEARRGGLSRYFGQIISSLVPEAELKHLINLRDGLTKEYQGHHALRSELRHLAASGLIMRKDEHKIADLTSGTTFDLADYVELTDLGRFLMGFADQELTSKLAATVRLAEEYLAPIDLAEADARATRIRQTFENARTVPKLNEMESYLRHTIAAHRVVGYFVCQVVAEREDISGWAPELAECLGREQQEALSHGETRPLWQLLVCITAALESPALTKANRDQVRRALRETQSFLGTNPYLDRGGECKWKIGELLG